MRLIGYIGIGLILISGFFLFGGAITSRRNVLDVGGIKVSAEDKRTISPWIAAAFLIAGGGMAVEGFRRKRA